MKTLPKQQRYETFSYLPPLTDAQINRQVQYIIEQGYIPAIEFDENPSAEQFYWTMWKLPLFSATSPQEVLNEVQQCRSEFPGSYVRLVAFDNIKQCQVHCFIVHRPNSNNYRY